MLYECWLKYYNVLENAWFCIFNSKGSHPTVKGERGMELMAIPCGLRKGEKCMNMGGCVLKTKDGKCAPAVKDKGDKEKCTK